MNAYFKPVAGTVLMLALAGCAERKPEVLRPGPDDLRPVPRPGAAPPPPPEGARTVEEFDTTTGAERAAALSAPQPGTERRLGRTIASLGDPARPGFWLQTPLVSAPAKGRVVHPETGVSVAVDLLPVEGPATAGSLISLAAMRLLGVPLTGLPELIVHVIAK